MLSFHKTRKWNEDKIMEKKNSYTQIARVRTENMGLRKIAMYLRLACNTCGGIIECQFILLFFHFFLSSFYSLLCIRIIQRTHTYEKKLTSRLQHKAVQTRYSLFFRCFFNVKTFCIK